MCRTNKQPTTGTDIPVVSRAADAGPDKSAGPAATTPVESVLAAPAAPAVAKAQRGLRLLRVSSLLLLAAIAVILLCRCNDTKMTVPPGEPTAPGASVVRVLLTSPAARQVEISTTGAYWLKVDGQVIARSVSAMPAVAVRRRGGAWQIGSRVARGSEVLLLPARDSMVHLGGRCYRGSLRLLADADDSFLAINHVEMESYLAGVLPKELYAAWAPATYEALAVAARTFATYHCTTTGRRSQYDLGDNQASQCYGGYSAETPKSRAAVDATRGVVLSYGPRGQERIFLAQYSACCGGQVNGAYVIRSAQRIEPLEGGQVCNDCAACSRYRWPAVRVRKADIRRALAARYAAARKLTRIDRIDVVTATPYGRAVWVDVVGNGESVRVRGEDVRLALIYAGIPAAKRLNSMNCRMVDLGDSIEFTDGRGFGHGVGLCQWGAQGKALKGWTAEQILSFYYPGATLYRVN